MVYCRCITNTIVINGVCHICGYPKLKKSPAAGGNLPSGTRRKFGKGQGQ